MSSNIGANTTMLISFSGIDGAGKSTQIQNLVSRMQDAGFRIRLITFWDDVVMLKNLREGAGHKVFKGDKGVGSPEAPIHRRDKNVRSPLMTLFRMAFYFLDAISLRKVTKQAQHSTADIIIFDRYLFDEFANLDLGNLAIRIYIRALLKLIPKPAVSFVLDADPVQAFARKPEYPLDFLHSNRKSYLSLSKIIPGITIIPPGSIEEAKARVVECVSQAQTERHLRAGTTTEPSTLLP